MGKNERQAMSAPVGTPRLLGHVGFRPSLCENILVFIDIGMTINKWPGIPLNWIHKSYIFNRKSVNRF